MATVKDSLDAWTTLVALVRTEEFLALHPDVNPEEAVIRMNMMIPKMVDALEMEINATATRSNRYPPLPGHAPAPVPAVSVPEDPTFEDFAALFEKYDRNVSDSIRIWFKDYAGGFDGTDSSDRADVYRRAATHYAEKRARRRAGDSHGPGGPKCQRCGSTDVDIRTSNSEKNKGKKYLACNSCPKENSFGGWL